MTKAAEHSEQDEAQEIPPRDPRPALLPPSPNPATNLLIADIVLRGASTLFRRRVARDIAAKAASEEDDAQKLVDGRSILTRLGLYGASRLATRSPIGLGLVAGGLVVKTLYDRGKARQKRLRQQHRKDAGKQ